MTGEVKTHYETLLAPVYTWMSGNHHSKVEDNLRFFAENNIRPARNKIAVDLGCGSGFQSLALAELGYEVNAVDFSPLLLSELSEHSGEYKIKTLEEDILNFLDKSTLKPELIICMGDTLTHLNSAADVKTLVGRSYALLQEGGKMIISYRDLSTALENSSRFIPVRSEEGRIFTCFLEYFDDYVKVFDILYENNNGKWEQKVSWYRKLRIPISELKSISTEAGFNLLSESVERGMCYLILEKQAA